MQESKTRHATNNGSALHKSEVTRTQRLEQTGAINEAFALHKRLTLDAGNGVHNVEWLIDLAFGVHPDFKSHVGGIMRFKEGHGLVINASTKQKLNTESSTVAELAGQTKCYHWHFGCHYF